ncbi:hypothetical protein MTR_3g053620 [Medicago truncatula]|uniref:Uncharacterized protein n=1 Tax=Medicago truncatula TaxID=3880 RepID=A0A072UWE9_MEDTR|nr:hypothetical protein MTR_3g053620 [Medicago truncatula]
MSANTNLIWSLPITDAAPVKQKSHYVIVRKDMITVIKNLKYYTSISDKSLDNKVKTWIQNSGYFEEYTTFI